MKVQAYTIMSKTSLALGYASMIGSIALWATGRIRGNLMQQNDGLFVGLWVPSFFILSNRYENLAQEALEQEELFLLTAEAQDTVEGRLTTNKQLPAGWREEVEEASKSPPTQSPRPLQHTRKH
jgi:hypothetical protein